MRYALRVALPVALTTVTTLLGGCSDDSSSPGGMGPVLTMPDEPDATTPTPVVDAGNDEDAGNAIRPACERVDVLQGLGAGEVGLNTTSLPADFGVSRVSIGFECDPGSLVLEHSGGYCPRGDGHVLSIALDAVSIESGTLPTGPIVIDALRSGITIRYRRPSTSNPGGEWGNCGSGDMGILELATVPSVDSHQVLEGRYQFTLVACDGKLNEPIDVVGSFRAKTNHSLAETCD